MLCNFDILEKINQLNLNEFCKLYHCSMADSGIITNCTNKGLEETYTHIFEEDTRIAAQRIGAAIKLCKTK